MTLNNTDTNTVYLENIALCRHQIYLQRSKLESNALASVCTSVFKQEAIQRHLWSCKLLLHERVVVYQKRYNNDRWHRDICALARVYDSFTTDGDEWRNNIST